MAVRLITLVCGQCLDRAANRRQVLGSVVLGVDLSRVWIPNVEFVVDPLDNTIATVTQDGSETVRYRGESLTATCSAHGKLSVSKARVRAWIDEGRLVEKIYPPSWPSVSPAA